MDTENIKDEVEIEEIEHEEKPDFDPSIPVEEAEDYGIYVKINLAEGDDYDTMRETLYYIDLTVVTRNGFLAVGPFERETNAFVAKHLIQNYGYDAHVVRM
jgi:hypothetical protein